jgi:Rrf2 family protein
MNLGQVEDYAVRALVDLAAHPETSVREVAGQTAVPGAHLAKVIQSLVRAGLVETTRGRGGGVRLARDPAEITVRQAVEAVQGARFASSAARAGARAAPATPTARSTASGCSSTTASPGSSTVCASPTCCTTAARKTVVRRNLTRVLQPTAHHHARLPPPHCLPEGWLIPNENPNLVQQEYPECTQKTAPGNA